MSTAPGIPDESAPCSVHIALDRFTNMVNIAAVGRRPDAVAARVTMTASAMTASGERCPICEDGHLSDKIEPNPVEYGGRSAVLALRYSVCDACGSELAGAEQVRANKRTMIAFRKQVDGLLTGAEVRALRERFGLNQTQAARLFGGGPVAFSKYENDDVAQSEAMDKLLRVAGEVPGALDFLASHASGEPAGAAAGGRQPVDDWRPEQAGHETPVARVDPGRSR